MCLHNYCLFMKEYGSLISSASVDFLLYHQTVQMTSLGQEEGMYQKALILSSCLAHKIA